LTLPILRSGVTAQAAATAEARRGNRALADARGWSFAQPDLRLARPERLQPAARIGCNAACHSLILINGKTDATPQ
jgi:hypothetical protein